MGFVIRTIVIAVAVAVVAYFYPSISYGQELSTLLIVAIVLGLLNAFVKPIIKVFTLPLNMMTFGLFGVVINAVLLLLVAFIGDLLGGSIGGLPFEFVIGGYPPEFGLDAIIAAIVAGIGISIVGAIVGMVVPD
jgi:putative membrane protein